MHGDPGTELWSDIGVLTRDNAHAAEVFDALTEAGVPVEIVGLSGLLRLPEVAEVVAVLHLLKDVTANASLLTLLTGPRWAIGPRDLKLLGDRARELAGARGRGPSPASVDDHLVAIADGIDPAEIACLDDALHDPGDAAYSTEALERFALLAAELRSLRSHVGEPLLDIVRRIIETTGVDVELDSAVTPAAAARRDNLDLFVRAVADFQAVDGDVTLVALLAYLTAEEEESKGLEVVAPSAADSVKLLTVHRAKGLEWGAVFLAGVCAGRFPSIHVADTVDVLAGGAAGAAARGRGGPPAARRLRQGRAGAVSRGHPGSRGAGGAAARLRRGHAGRAPALGHVVLLEPAGDAVRPVGLPGAGSRAAGGVGRARRRVAGRPRQGRPQPLRRRGSLEAVATHRHRRRGAAAARRGRDGARRRPDGGGRRPRHDRDRPRRRLGRRARAAPRRGPGRPQRRDRRTAARQPVGDRAAPPPGRRGRRSRRSWPGRCRGRRAAPPGSAPCSTPGSRTASSSSRCSTPTSSPAAATSTSPTRATSRPSSRRSSRVPSPTGCRTPSRRRSRWSSTARSSGAGSTRSTRSPTGGFLVVDWKTNRHEDADPLQLAVYRLAWAELRGVPLDEVAAAFHYVRTGSTVEPEDLPDRQALEAILGA